MNTKIASVTPTWYWVIAILATLWYLLGAMAWYVQISMGPEAVATLSAGEQAFYGSLPGWYNYVFGVAVLGGFLACIGLLMRRFWALPLFVVSLLAVLVQDGYAFGPLEAMKHLGSSSIVMPAIVIVIGLCMLWFARSTKARGILT